jgi:hypothetical protein
MESTGVVPLAPAVLVPAMDQQSSAPGCEFAGQRAPVTVGGPAYQDGLFGECPHYYLSVAGFIWALPVASGGGSRRRFRRAAARRHTQDKRQSRGTEGALGAC